MILAAWGLDRMTTMSIVLWSIGRRDSNTVKSMSRLNIDVEYQKFVCASTIGSGADDALVVL